MFKILRKILVFCFAVPLFLRAEPAIPGIVAATEGDPSAIVAGCVNAITGDYVLSDEDLVIRGAVPLVLRKTYVSGNGKNADTGWSFFPHFVIEGYPLNKRKAITFYVPEPTGAVLRYTTIRHEQDWVELKPIIQAHAIGMTNNSSGMLSGRTNLKNNRLHYYCGTKSRSMQVDVITGEGLRRYYKRWRFNNSKQCDEFVLLKEELPNGCWIVYESSNEGRPTFVKVVNPDASKTFAYARFHYFGPEDENRNCRIETSDGRVLEYLFETRKAHKKGPIKNRFYLRDVKGSLPFAQSYVPSSPPPNFHSLLQEVWRGGVLQQKIFHHYRDTHNPLSNRVKEIFQPDPTTGNMVCTHSINYQLGKWRDDDHGFDSPGITTVNSADGLTQQITWTPEMRAYEYRFFEGHTQLAWHRLYWGKEKTEMTGNLKARSLCSPDGKPIRTRVFDYDGKFNVVKDTLHGNLSGLGGTFTVDGEGRVYGGERYEHYYVYSSDGRNLILEEREDNGKVTRYQYLPGTSLPTAEFVGNTQKILKRHFYEYDSDHLLITEISDNGSSSDPNNLENATLRTVKKIHRRGDGMPSMLEEYFYDHSTKEYNLLSRQVLHHSHDLLLTQQDHHDAHGSHVYSIHYRYDHLGRIIAKTDPIGRTEEFTFDGLGRCVEHRQYSGLKATYFYDALGHLLQKHEMGNEGEKHTECYTYNACGKLIAKTDFLGITTTNQLDPLGRKRRTDHPNGSSEHFSYDHMGCLAKVVNRNGGVTTTSYNAYGKPLCIQYPDGSFEKCTYNLDGSLKEKTDCLGAIHRFHYDVLGHVIHTQTFSPEAVLLKENRYIYDGDLLIEEIDGEGHVCYYKYDGAGRKIAEQKHAARTTYSYDKLGRLRCADAEGWTQEFFCDLLGQITCERILAHDGRLVKEERYVYDQQGNRSEVHRGDSVEHFFYDGFNRLIAKIDPTGITTHYTYDESTPGILRKTTTDALGTQLTETFGSMGEKKLVEVYSVVGEHLLREEYDYDAAGNCTTQKAHLPRGITTTKRTFDHSGNLLELIEAYGSEEQKITRHHYHSGKLLAEIHRNDGDILYHEYDVLGRMTFCRAKSGGGYRYTYDKASRITEVQDLSTGLVSKRSYHPSGQVASEQFMHGLSVRYKRDTRGRPLEFHLPDKSGVAYGWDAIHLRTIIRFDAEARICYEHEYQERDITGRPVVSRLPLMHGHETKYYDPAGRLDSIMTLYHQHIVVERTPSGHMSKVEHKLPFHSDVTELSYDNMHQLKKENSALFQNHFDFDPHGTLLKRNGQETVTNALYQVKKIDGRDYSYDVAGRLLCDGQRLYYYDAFDRLVAVEETNKYRTEYAYDSWHRRMQKNFFVWQENRWALAETRFFLYDGMLEIGSCDEEGNIIDFRMLGTTTQAELGSTLAIEIRQRLFIPFHDLRGNITCLVNAQTKKLQEVYRYSAFGDVRVFDGKGEEFHNSLAGNPWLFCGKRYDEESGLIYFGRRYYHAHLNNWITPDPAGAIDRPNLYSFLRANPMTFFDAVGFSAEDRAASLQMRHDWQNTSTAFTRGVSTAATTAIKPVGYALYYGSYHLPIPYVRDTLVSTGAFLSQNPDHKVVHSKSYCHPGADPFPRAFVGYVNGMYTSFNEFTAFCSDLSQKLYNQTIHGCYNATHGPLIDFIFDIGREFFFRAPTHAAKVLYNDITQAYDKMSNAFPDGDFILAYLVHSEGNLLMNSALHRLAKERPEILDKMHILGLGSPIAYGKDIVDIRIFNSEGDGIGMLSHLGRSADFNVQFGPSKNGSVFLDHGILGETYQKEIDRFCDSICNKWNI